MTDFLPMVSTFICRGQLCNLHFGGVLEVGLYLKEGKLYFPGFLNVSSIESMSWVILCAPSPLCAISSVMVLYTQQEPVQPHHCSLPTRCQQCPLFLICDNQDCPQTLPNVPQGEKWPPVENHCCSPAFSPINGCSSHDTFFSLHFLSFLYLIMFQFYHKCLFFMFK